jgi:hypothetical protein
MVISYQALLTCSCLFCLHLLLRAFLHSPAPVHTPGVPACPLQRPPHQLLYSATTQRQPPAALLCYRRETSCCRPSRLLLAMHPAPTRSKASTLTTTISPATSLPHHPEAFCHQCRTCGGPADMVLSHQQQVLMLRLLHSAQARTHC